MLEGSYLWLPARDLAACQDGLQGHQALAEGYPPSNVRRQLLTEARPPLHPPFFIVSARRSHASLLKIRGQELL